METKVIRPALPLLLLPLGGLWLGLFCAQQLTWRSIYVHPALVVAGGLAVCGLVLLAGRLLAGKGFLSPWPPGERTGSLGAGVRVGGAQAPGMRECERPPSEWAAAASHERLRVRCLRVVTPPLLAVIVGLMLGLLFWTSAGERATAVAAALEARPQESHALVIDEDPKEGAICASSVATLEVEGVGSLKVRVYWEREQTPLPLGTHLQARVALKPLTATQEFLHQRGVLGSVTLEDMRVEGFPATPLGLIHSFREHNRLMLAERGGEGSALLRGVLIGETTELDRSEAGRAFKVTGLTHLVAVSGGHLVVIALLLSWLIGRLGLRRSVEVALITTLLVAYVLLTGLQPSAIRACIMTFIASMSGFAGRRGHAPSALATAAVGMLLLHPPTAFSVGFWLSVYAVLGLTLFCSLVTRSFECLLPAPDGASPVSDGNMGKLVSGLMSGVGVGPVTGRTDGGGRTAQEARVGERRWRRIRRALRGALLEPLALTTTAQMATAPLTAPLFGTISLVSPLANLLVAPLMTLIIGGGIIALFLMPLLSPVAPLMLDALILISDLSIALAKWCAQLSHACLPVAVDLVIANVVALAVAALIYRLWPQPSRRRVLRGAAVLLSFALLLGASTFLPVAPQVVALNVGQGDAILIRDGYHAVLVDTGRDDATLLKALARQRVSRLDAVIITHLDDDHCGAIDALGGTIAVERVYFAADLPEEQAGSEVMRAARQLLQGATPGELSWGDSLHLSRRVELAVLWPEHPISEGVNEESICLALSYDEDGDGEAEARLLLTGDAEAPELQSLLAQGDAQQQRFGVLKVGHHGSKDAVTPEQLRRMGCQLALISVGRDNRYGHPAPETLAALDQAGVRVYRTDLNGDIRLRFDGGIILVRCDTMGE